MTTDIKSEPLLIEDDNRHVLQLSSSKYKPVWEMYEKHVSTFWTVKEIDLSKDNTDWDKLNLDEQEFIKNILAFFAGSDGIVNENLALRFYDEVKSAEVRAFYSFQIAMETIHANTYSLLIEQYIKDNEEKLRLYNSSTTIPCVEKKAQWAIKWISSKDASFAKRLLAFACVEGIFFSGAFCSIFWLKDRKLMPGLCFSNELIARDESLHTEFAMLLYTQYIVNKLSQEEVYDMFKEAVAIENEFIVESISCRMIGMNTEMMTEYIQFVADRLLVQLGYNKLYKVNNPFPFMEKISIENKTNFFEARVSEYSKAEIGNTGDINLDAEF
jgi:ribonucleotide reductase beta subunit family protein with ferritin-like domain